MFRAVRHPAAVIPPFVERTYRCGPPAEFAGPDGGFATYLDVCSPGSHYRVVGIRILHQRHDAARHLLYPAGHCRSRSDRDLHAQG
ncbi:hypothetical protein CBM2589_U10238 [Cupriavidus taiwanensis]|uniref:Uncharacterized protein n=1 Tax=Cupriavidus taiwanensis TaxID=164546 RepID=A0A375CQP6_9BURK|nr:hypothetical protein CBM2589_U10238 [Cupriavidus taiwanensis]